MMTSADAKAFARVHHSGALDKAEQPYIEHLERVVFAAERRAQHAHDSGLPVDPDQVTQAAWLHDVIENTSVMINELRETGFSEAVIAIVELLTKPKGQASEGACRKRSTTEKIVSEQHVTLPAHPLRRGRWIGSTGPISSHRTGVRLCREHNFLCQKSLRHARENRTWPAEHP
jgi:hypothetical protein